MTAAVDWTDPMAVLEEARRRQSRRDQGQPLSEPSSPSEPNAAYEADGSLPWQEVQRRCYRVFANGGCEVYWLSQARKTGQTPGLPDLIVFGPPGAPFLLMWETKAGRGKLSESQRKFALHCQRTKTHHASGGVWAARRALRTLIEAA